MSTTRYLLLIFLACGSVWGQDAATPQTNADVTEKNVQEYIQLLRADVRHQKSQIMGAMMQLNSDEAAQFWPIYKEYDSELDKLNEVRVANIREYANNYDNLTDVKADELVRTAFDYQKQRSALLSKYYERVKAALGGVQAARFAQIESQLLMIIDLQIASALPIAGQE